MAQRQPPAFVQFYPTLRCNLSCGFCFNRGVAQLPDVDPKDFGLMLDRLRAAGVGALDLLGGEPTLHPRLEELVATVVARGMRTTLSTNGAGDLAVLEGLEERCGRETVRVGVSVNDEAIPAPLADYLRRRSPMVKSVCARDGRLPAAAAAHLARPGTEFFLIFRDAVAPGDLGECLSYPEFTDRLAALRRRHPRASGVVCGGFLPRAEDGPEAAAARCPAGTAKLSVLPDGSVYPCYLFFSRPEFRLGNLLVDDLEAILGHPMLGFFRSFRGNTCPRRDCAHHAACRGGCPAVSLLVTGDLAAPDPRCAPGGRYIFSGSKRMPLRS